MNMRILPAQTRVFCGGEHTGCTFYQNHEDWPELLKQGFHIPAGEEALLIRHTCKGINFFLCQEHAVEFLKSVRMVCDNAKELGWILNISKKARVLN